MLNKIVDSELNEIIVFGKRCSDKNAPLAFPEEWRIKAMQYDDSVFQHSREANSEFLLDQSMPMSVRKAAIGKIELEAKGVAQLLNAAADEQNPGHADYRVLVEGFLVSKQCHEGIPGSIIAEHGNVGVPVSIGAKKLLFSFIKNEKTLTDALKSALWAAIEDEENGSKDSEKIQFFKWAFATAKNPKVIAEIIRIPGTSKEKILQDLIYMANCIDDDTVLADLLVKDSDLKSGNVYSPLVEALVSRIKDPQIKKDAGTLALAYNAVDPKKRAKALVEVYAKSPEKAYGVAMEWFSTEHYDGNVKGHRLKRQHSKSTTLRGLIVYNYQDKNMLPQSLTIQFTVDKSEDFNDGYPSHGLMWNLPSSGNSQPFHGAYIQGTKFNLYLRGAYLDLPKIEPSETVYTIRWQMDPENNNLWATTSQNKKVIAKARKQTQYPTEFRNRAFSFHMSNNASTTGYWLLKSIKISIKE